MKLFSWFQKLWLRPSNAGPAPTSGNSSPSSPPKSTPDPNTRSATNEAKASGWQADPRSEKNLATVRPELQKLGRELLRRLSGEGLTFKVIQGRRTQAEQDALYAKGRTAPGPKVTWTRNSRHLTGRAIDLALFQGKNVVWESKHYTRAGELGEELGLVWGGRWRGGKTDKPHFELAT